MIENKKEKGDFSKVIEVIKSRKGHNNNMELTTA